MVLRDTTRIICFRTLFNGHHCIDTDRMRRSKLPIVVMVKYQTRFPFLLPPTWLCDVPFDLAVVGGYEYVSIPPP